MNFRKGCSSKVNIFSSLATTVTRQLDETAEDTEAQWFERINESLWYVIQVDKSVSVDKKSNNPCFCVMYFQDDLHEDLLYAFLLQTNITPAEICQENLVILCQYMQMECLLQVDSVPVSQLVSKRLFLSVSLCILSSTENTGWLKNIS